MLVVAMLIAWAITKAVFTYKVDREYARQGIQSPRYQVKLAKLAAAGQPAAAADSTAWGAKDYVKTLVRDAFADAKDRHNRIRAEKEAGTYVKPPSLGERLSRFGQWLWSGNRPEDVGAAGGGAPAGQNTDSQQKPATPPAPDPAPADGSRIACPVCGDTLKQEDDKWVHPPESTCKAVNPGAAPAPATTSGAAPAASAGAPAPAPAPARHAEPTTPAASDTGGSTPLGGDNLTRAALDALADCDPSGQRRAKNMDDASEAVQRAFPAARPEAVAAAVDRADKMPGCNECGQRRGVTPMCPHRQAHADRLRKNAADLTAAHRKQQSNTTHTNSNGGTMTATQTDMLRYNEAVAAHEASLVQLRAQLAQAYATRQHIESTLAAVEALDGNREETRTALAALTEGMEGSQFGADATQGSAEATTTMTAGKIGEVQEHLESAKTQNEAWIAELTAAIEGVQASLQHMKAQFGEAAATVQETGVKGAALEDA